MEAAEQADGLVSHPIYPGAASLVSEKAESSSICSAQLPNHLEDANSGNSESRVKVGLKTGVWGVIFFILCRVAKITKETLRVPDLLPHSYCFAAPRQGVGDRAGARVAEDYRFVLWRFLDCRMPGTAESRAW